MKFNILFSYRKCSFCIQKYRKIICLFHLRSRIHTVNDGNQIPELYSVICCQGYGALDPAMAIQSRMGKRRSFLSPKMPLKSHPLIKTVFALEKKILFEKEISFYQLQKSAPVNRTQQNFGESRTCIKIARLIVLWTNKRVKIAVALHIRVLPGHLSKYLPFKTTLRERQHGKK